MKINSALFDPEINKYYQARHYKHGFSAFDGVRLGINPARKEAAKNQ
jgi:hypothetical protein